MVNNQLPADEERPHIIVGEWEIWKWTGWKEHRDQMREGNPLLSNHLYGQWIAFRPKGRKYREAAEYLYVAIPGGEGTYRPGDAFDIELKPGQVQVTIDTPQEEKDRLKREGYQRLLVLIHEQS